MIRDFTQRDPGILTYKTPREIDFHVYPFISNETRVADIEFQFPRSYHPNILIGDQTVALHEKDDPLPSKIFIGRVPSQGTFVLLPGEKIATLPKLHRRPYLHFILDYSAGTSTDVDRYLAQMKSVIARFPEAKNAKVTAAHFNIEELTHGFISLENPELLRAVLQEIFLTHRGALDIGRVIKQELIRDQQSLQDSSA